MLYDVFICHASEDKEPFVRPLADALRNEHVEVWYDDFSLKLGDSIRRSLDKGLSQSRFGLVVLSKAFFTKNWPKYELDGLVEKEIRGNDNVILPIWHDVSHDEVADQSPSLANRKSVLSSVGLPEIVSKVLAVIHPQGSPLIVARDTLIEWGLTPPVITDEYWLRVVEASNRVPGYGAMIPVESHWGRWSFPLPSSEGGAEKWGGRLAWTAMQMNWIDTAEKLPISPLTRPQIVLQFIKSHPGLFEACITCPDLFAEYAPQLTIRGFGGEIEEVIEKEYKKSCAKWKKERARKSSFGSDLTTNGKCPSCDDEWILRHPSFGDYEPVHIAYEYFNGDIYGPQVSPFEGADHTFWLLSSSSSWLPRHIHDVLIEGMRNWITWLWGELTTDHQEQSWKTYGALTRALYDLPKATTKFRWTDETRDDALNRIRLSIRDLNLEEKPEELFDRFVRLGFPACYLKTQRRLQRKRNSHKSGGRKQKGSK
jgi:hypothetical protein